MKLWAFCISPHGLGLSELDFWCLSYREINALKAVYDQSIWRWAHQQAALYNANTRFDMQGIPWIAEDFLRRGYRASRIEQVSRSAAQKAKDDRELEFLNFKCDMIKKNKKGKDVPFWALADWDGSIPAEEAQFAQVYGRQS